MILVMVVAEKLGKSLTEVFSTMTQEEIILWSVFYELRAEQEREAMDKARRLRR